ncbi:hypothetical protein ACGFY9_48595 [Streptomyces sp. NPDC048504]|uniref:hypothetical protein n=1 Tax=Streptomyces sp. NPDC048504 TaxID=3365559 RepID=UPI0037118DBA
MAGALLGLDTEAQARALAEDLRQRDGDGAITQGAGTVDRDAVVRAATLEVLSDPWNASARGRGRASRRSRPEYVRCITARAPMGTVIIDRTAAQPSGSSMPGTISPRRSHARRQSEGCALDVAILCAYPLTRIA